MPHRYLPGIFDNKTNEFRGPIRSINYPSINRSSSFSSNFSYYPNVDVTSQTGHSFDLPNLIPSIDLHGGVVWPLQSSIPAGLTSTNTTFADRPANPDISETDPTGDSMWKDFGTGTSTRTDLADWPGWYVEINFYSVGFPAGSLISKAGAFSLTLNSEGIFDSSLLFNGVDTGIDIKYRTKQTIIARRNPGTGIVTVTANRTLGIEGPASQSWTSPSPISHTPTAATVLIGSGSAGEYCSYAAIF